jgi:hypothetical protein
MWTSKSGSWSSIAAMKPGKLARSRSCFFFIVASALMTKRKSILPWQPMGCCGPKSGMAMSRTGELSAVEPELVDVEDEVDDPSASAVEVDEEPDTELLDPAGPIVTVDPIPLENPVEPALPPQEARPRRSDQERAGTHGRASLARSRAPVIHVPGPPEHCSTPVYSNATGRDGRR